ncbi:PREDICTED: glutathione S-transferase T1-like isoform X2 [Ipomoea nil]|uniref:glutathione S-transferase T1-like isoform X2 n=1 Tax=Ipomoea nil TaxID=35883 RepID=UPI0009010504|nr:PREDICTED: glutathione S-transferase T1-like isoform X2 [Ipomoea nil]
MTLKLYVDRMSQPSRALLIFCKANGIDFEEVQIQIAKGQHRTPEYAAINPMKQVPAVVDGDFKLFESHAALKYLAAANGVADHWYPADLQKRAKVDSVCDWHHSNLRRGAAGYVFNTALAPAFGLPCNPHAAAEAEKVLLASLGTLESFWLQGDGDFLLGNTQPSLADLSLVCELMQLEVLDDKERERIISPYKKVLKWMEDVKEAIQPHFDEVHTTLFHVKEMLKQKRSAAAAEK